MTENKNIDLSIPMLPDMEITATAVAESLGAFIGLDQDKIEEVKIALIEACINAFEHSKSPARRIDINFQITDRGLRVLINDGGEGFDIKEALERIAEKREKGLPRGWGLTLMNELMDELDIDTSDRGTLITMVKYR
jgi:serine/threonine-protein kinase RsbW